MAGPEISELDPGMRQDVLLSRKAAALILGLLAVVTVAAPVYTAHEVMESDTSRQECASVATALPGDTISPSC
jgi:hypothetical protein